MSARIVPRCEYQYPVIHDSVPTMSHAPTEACSEPGNPSRQVKAGVTAVTGTSTTSTDVIRPTGEGVAFTISSSFHSLLVQSLTAPPTSPRAMKRWETMKTIAIGRMATIVATIASGCRTGRSVIVS